MYEFYTWATWFNNLCEKIAENGEDDLVDRAQRVAWTDTGKMPKLFSYGDDYIDPFSVISTITIGFTKKSGKRIYESINEIWQLEPIIPIEIDEATIFPRAKPFAALFHGGHGKGNPELLWRLFRSAINGLDSIDNNDFLNAQAISGVAISKLTQALFLINSKEFLPWDTNTSFLLNRTISKPQPTSYTAYIEILNEFRELFPGCQYREMNLLAYSLKSEEFSLKGGDSYQVSTNVYNEGNDLWDDFDRENAIWTSGPGTISWDDFVEDAPVEGTVFPLTDPVAGDLVFVRFSNQGRGIGVVYKNEYPTEYSSKARIHVIWINKSKVSNLLNIPQTHGFSRAHSIARTFLTHSGYKATQKLLSNLGPVNDDEVESKEKLNQVLFGPPGTGKTYHTVNLALSIIDGSTEPVHDQQRFKDLRDAGNIEVVTFHQSFSYEDFVEGIRPVLRSEELRYELSNGIFKKICKEASRRTDEKFVLIIDEINRGNIAKIFGELITLIEDSRRSGRPEESHVKLPYSREMFVVPSNVYLIGTMNTADRSIQLLDSALRRRFTFHEFMPDERHPRIKTDVEGVDCQKLLSAINERIIVLLDREHQIGHTYLLNVENLDDLAFRFQEQIFPLLQEYFFDDWVKIRTVLANNAFVLEKQQRHAIDKAETLDEDKKIYVRLASDDDRWRSADQYKKIYQS